MLSARDLVILWGDTPRYGRWTSDPESRYMHPFLTCSLSPV
uniref:Uncharacterized protein n=1 Tax=Rhizophora mucronata TaxID=61149 RepID=A0A2P2K0P4_RHIMU